ncbi:hypothetical protein [Azospirillum argentinense]
MKGHGGDPPSVANRPPRAFPFVSRTSLGFGKIARPRPSVLPSRAA